MHANLAIHALLVAAFLCCFWLMLRPRLGGMSHLRRWALLLTTPYVLLAFMLASPTVFSAFIESATRLEAVPLALFIILGSGTSSVVCVELARGVVAKAGGWDDRVHFSVVGVAWLLLAILQSVFVYLGREALHPLHGS